MKFGWNTVRNRWQLVDSTFDWCLQNGLAQEREGKIEEAARWARLAAWTGHNFGHSRLCSRPLETFVARMGRQLATRANHAGRGVRRSPSRWLHVFTRTGVIGGHTAVARRWIDHNPFSEQHSLALTGQAEAGADPRLLGAVARSGGRVVSFSGESALIARAVHLREMASSEADVVVLHADPTDVVPALAFAAPGGPPVLLFNHADDTFWVGAAAVDLVIDFRESGLHLTRKLRGVRRSAVLPLPLQDDGPAPAGRTAAAARMADPSPLERDLVLLTIGRERKYSPIRGLNFPETVKSIVQRIPGCSVIAVGPSPRTPHWRRLKAETGGRVVAVGRDPDLRVWHAAADVYLEGFPVGSITALMEVALAGRAFVRKPLLVPAVDLPVDRGALADFPQPETTEAYVANAVALCQDPARREAQGARARAAMLADHCGEGWAAHLAALRAQLPAVHEPETDLAIGLMPASLKRHWAEYYAKLTRMAPPMDAVLKQAAAMELAAESPQGWNPFYTASPR